MSEEHFHISAAELAERLRSDNPPMLLDVREVGEHEMAALPDSKLIPLAQVPFRVGEIADWKERDVVIYCHHGVRSLMAIGWLKLRGFSKLHNLTGGIDRWSVEVDTNCPRY
jgi:rhodanese-related sulfurtransferase